MQLSKVQPRDVCKNIVSLHDNEVLLLFGNIDLGNRSCLIYTRMLRGTQTIPLRKNTSKQ